jgi:hypothetical protein
VLGTLIVIAAVVPRWFGIIGFGLSPERRWTPEALYGFGVAGAGIAAIAFIASGVNDLWFALSASVPLSVLSAAGLATWSRSIPSTKHLARNAVVLGLLALFAGLLTGYLVRAHGWAAWQTPLIAWAVVLIGGFLQYFRLVEARRKKSVVRTTSLFVTVCAIVFVGAGSRIFAVIPAIQTPPQGASEFAETDEPPQPENSLKFGWDSNQYAAGRFIDFSAQRGDIIATNIVESGLVPALTSRRAFIGGAFNQRGFGLPDSVNQIDDRIRTSLAFINEPDDLSLQQLRDADVQWLWIDPRLTNNRSWEPYAETLLVTDSVIIAQMR